MPCLHREATQREAQEDAHDDGAGSNGGFRADGEARCGKRGGRGVGSCDGGLARGGRCDEGRGCAADGGGDWGEGDEEISAVGFYGGGGGGGVAGLQHDGGYVGEGSCLG